MDSRISAKEKILNEAHTEVFGKGVEEAVIKWLDIMFFPMHIFLFVYKKYN